MIDKIQIDTNYFDTFGLSLIMIDKIQIDTNYFDTLGLSLIMIDKIQIDTNYFDTFQGRIQGGGGGTHPARAPPKIGKNKIFFVVKS